MFKINNNGNRATSLNVILVSLLIPLHLFTKLIYCSSIYLCTVSLLFLYMKIHFLKTFPIKYVAQKDDQKVFCYGFLFSKCEQIHSFLRICSHLLKKFLTKNFIFCSVICSQSTMKTRGK